jgi:hypothetical protein
MVKEEEPNNLDSKRGGKRRHDPRSDLLDSAVVERRKRKRLTTIRNCREEK